MVAVPTYSRVHGEVLPFFILEHLPIYTLHFIHRERELELQSAEKLTFFTV